MSFTPSAGFGSFETGREGHRVVACQRILQAQSDPFLGFIAGVAGESQVHQRVDYYWRQFRDMKGSIDTRGFTPSQFCAYVGLCAKLLARAHSQSPGGAVIAGYLDDSERFDLAIASWSAAYADQTERDYAALEQTARSGRVPVERGV